MATLDLRVSIADEDLPRLLTAARAAFDKPNLTEAEVVEGIRQHGIGLIQQLVRNYERKVALAQAEALDPKVSVS